MSWRGSASPRSRSSSSSSSREPQTRYVLQLSDPLAETTDLAGGKGASLARLTRAGFPVPGGVVVSTRAYADFVAGMPELADRVAGLSAADPAGLAGQAAALRAELAAQPLPAGLAEELAAS